MACAIERIGFQVPGKVLFLKDGRFELLNIQSPHFLIKDIYVKTFNISVLNINY